MAAQSTYSLAFDGSSGTVAAQLTPPSGQFALSFWIKTSSTGKGVLGWNNQSDGAGGVDDREVTVDGSGKIKFYIFDGATREFASDTAVNDGAWHHVLCGISSTGLEIWIDGVQQSGTIAGVTHGYNGYSAPYLVWGACRRSQDNGGTRYLPGSLDDLALLSSFPTGGQIAAIAGTPGVAGSSSLDVGTLTTAGLWRMEEGSGTATADSSGNGNTGTFGGVVSWSTLNDVPLPLQAGAGGGVVTSLLWWERAYDLAGGF